MQNQIDYSLLVVAGYPRTGTTSIYHNLELHPGFAVPVRKELNFFCQANPPLARYKSYFPRHREEQVCVDVSPMYSVDPAVPARLHAAVPHARVVMLLREPTTWIQSLYTMISSFTPNMPTFDQFLENPLIEQFGHEVRFSLSEGVYRRSLSDLGSVFGDNLLVIDFAAFQREPLAILKEIEAFAGASPYFTSETVDARQHNSSKLARRHPPRLRWLLGKESVVETASKVVPAPLLRRARSMLYYERAKSPSAVAPSPSEHDVALATAATAADRETYSEIFKTKQIRRGSEFQ